MTRVRLFSLVMIGLILCAGPTWAESKANKANNKTREKDHPIAQQRTCLLPNPWRVLKVPGHFSPEQKAYLPELCRLVQSEFAISLTDDPSLPPLYHLDDPTEEKLTVRETLYRSVQGHLETLVWLLEEAFKTKPFNQGRFWQAWQEARDQYFLARSELLRLSKVDRSLPRLEMAKSTSD